MFGEKHYNEAFLWDHMSAHLFLTYFILRFDKCDAA